MNNLVITGVNSGVGHAAAEFFSKKYNVFGISRNDNNLGDLYRSPNFKFIKADISNSKDVSAAFSQIENIYCLINCAAIFESTPFIKQKVDLIEQIIDTNLKGTIFVTRAALEKMDSGRIINISSVSGKHGIKNQAAYSASKHGITGFMDSLNQELVEKGVQVTNLCPGGIKTPLWGPNNPYKGDLSRLLTPEDIVRILNFIMESPSRIVFKELIVFPDSEIH
jgi:3-oxoacyl-[acyl-carrier protein] reductase